MKNSGWSVKHVLLLILISAVCIRLVFSLAIDRALLGAQPELQSTDGYHALAESLLRGDGYRFRPSEPLTVERPPGYPAFMLAIFTVVGVNYVAVQIAQALLAAITCWLLFLMGRWILSPELGLTAAAMYAVYANSIEYSARLYQENLYFPLFVAFAYLLCRASMEGSWRKGVAAGVLWGASLLTRGTLFPLPLVLPFGLVISPRHRSPSKWVKWAIPAALSGAMVVAPWAVRNYELTQSFVPVSSVAWAALYHGTQVSKRKWEWVPLLPVDSFSAHELHQAFVERFHKGENVSAFETTADAVRYDKVAKEMTLRDWGNDPIGFVQRSASGVFFTWFFSFNPLTRLVSLAIHLPLLVLFVVGAIRMARLHVDAFVRAWPALGLILFVNAFQAVAYPHVRYMSPAIVLSFLFSALPVLAIFHSLARRWTDSSSTLRPAVGQDTGGQS